MMGLGLRLCSCTRMVPAALPTAWRLYGRQAVAVSHRAVGLTIYSEWWQTTLLFVVQCCLCSSKRQRMCIPTISGRFVSSSLHIYPACSHCTAFHAPTALCFELLQSPCMYLARFCVYWASMPLYPSINTAFSGNLWNHDCDTNKTSQRTFTLGFYGGWCENVFWGALF